MNQLSGVGHTFRKLTKNLLGGALLLALGLALGSNTARATNETWIVNSGTFGTAANWDTGLAPVDGDVTFFTNETSITVSLGANTPNLLSTVISNHTGVVTINPNGLTYRVTNTFRVGVADSISTVFITGGTLAVAGVTAVTGQLRIGDSVTNVPGLFCTGTLVVTNGTVAADAGIVGASSNSVGTLVITGNGVYTDGGTGSGSTLTIGSSSGLNRLIITNGGRLFVDGTITVGNGIGLTNNSMLLSGPTSGATITSAGDLKFSGNGGSLIISNGAKLFETGSFLFGGTASFNTGVVTGAGSQLIAQGSVQIGLGGAGATNNLFTVQDGAFISCGGTFAYGNNSSNIHNGFVMGGTGLTSTGSFVVVRSSSVNTNHQDNFIIVTNAFMSCNFLNPQGPIETISVNGKGTLVVTNSISLGVPAGNSNSINVAGSMDILRVDNGTLLNPLTSDNVGGVNLGGTGGNNLIVTNGGVLLSGNGTIGANSSLNTGIVIGASSVWSNSSSVANYTNHIIVGTGTGGTNFLGVFDGGKLYNNGTFSIGNNITSVFNTVKFGGPGAAAIVVNTGSLNIGAASNTFGNVLTITNASVTITNLNVGNSAAISNSLVLNGGALSVGFMRVRPTNTVTFSGGVLSAGGATVDSHPDIPGTFAVGDGTAASGAVYEMAAGGTGYHNFNSGGLTVTNNATLRGGGTVAGNVTNLGIFSPGIGAAVGTVLFSNNLVFGSSAVLNYHLGTLQDSVGVSNSLTLAGTVNVTGGAGFGANVYTLFTYSNLVSSALAVGTLPGGFSATVSNDPATTRILLVVTAGGGGDPYSTTWATHYGLSGGNALGTADPDGDGMNNTNEFLAGFNPTSSGAYVHITSISKTNGGADIRVDYLGASGDSTYTGGPASRTNVLEFTTGTGGNYNSNTFVTANVTNILSGGTGLGTLTNMVDPGGATGATRYYRVRVLVP